MSIHIPLLFIFSLFISACDDRSASASKEPYFHAAKLYPIKSQTLYKVSRNFTGYVVAPQQGIIGFELAGKISSVAVEIGNPVEKGTLLATLDTTLLQIDKQQQQAQLAEFDAQLKLNESSLNRLVTLKKDGYASQQRIDELHAERDSINASIKRLQAALAAIVLRMEKSILRAPFDGIVTERFIDAGSVVNVGTPVIKLINNSNLEARIGIPQRLATPLQEKQTLALTIATQTLNGTIIAVGSDVSPATRTVPIRLQLPDKSTFLNGTLVEVTIEEQVEQAGYWIPLSAIVDGPRGLWAVYGAVPQSTPHPKPKPYTYQLQTFAAQIQYSERDRIYIKADLQGVDFIVEDGLHRLVPGQIIRSSSPAQR